MACSGEGRSLQARRLRKAPTYAERLLWSELRKLDLHFRRQAPIGPYIVDFCCHRAKLLIEIDGYFHTLPERVVRDSKREDWLKAQGFRVLRFLERDVREHREKVVEIILRTAAPPFPLRGEGPGMGVTPTVQPPLEPSTSTSLSELHPETLSPSSPPFPPQGERGQYLGPFKRNCARTLFRPLRGDMQ